MGCFVPAHDERERKKVRKRQGEIDREREIKMFSRKNSCARVSAYGGKLNDGL